VNSISQNVSAFEKTLNSKDFAGVFAKVDHSGVLGLHNPNHVHIYHLNIENNIFTYDGLHKFLQNNVGRYVFSRAQLNKFRVDGDAESIGLKAIELLRKSLKTTDSGAGGELGEILLYAFLEEVLGAPKLLTKVELKTSTNMYVNGSDGVHLFSGNGNSMPFYQLVLGESKIKGDLKSAINEAFKSIREMVKNPTNEIRLIESNIFKETYTHEEAEYIKNLILPEKRGDKQYDKAFGVFLGYSLDLDVKNLSNIECRAAIKNKLVEDIMSAITHIVKKINEKDDNGNDLSGYSFYFYTLPFNNTDTDRRTIINRLVGGSSN
jgi:hypothetical protein